MKIVALGDSLTYGYGVGRQKAWPSLVASFLGLDLINKGINGDTVLGMLSRFEKDVIKEHPDILIITGGTNDIIFSSSLSATKLGMVSIVYQALAHRIIPFVGLPLPVHPASVPEIWSEKIDFNMVSAKVEEYVQWLQEASSIMGNRVIDFYHLFYEDAASKGTFFIDGLHPTEEGHKLMADVVIHKVREYEVY